MEGPSRAWVCDLRREQTIMRQDLELRKRTQLESAR